MGTTKISEAIARNYQENPWKTYDHQMSILVDTTYRTDAEEIMDDFSIDGPLLHDTLDTLAKINTWLGGNKVTIDGLKIVLKDHPKSKPITIVDLGCGGGDILRDVSEFGKKHGYHFNLIGIDANAEAVRYANQLSGEYDHLEFQQIDITTEEFDLLKYDVVLCTLFLHHFKNEQLFQLLQKLKDRAKIGVVVNDLHRHRLAYYLFKLITLPVKNQMIIEDGLTSVLRGFKRKDLVNFSEKLGVKYQLKWKWAFRWQWVIFK